MPGVQCLRDLPVNEHFIDRYEPREVLGYGSSGEVRVYYDRWMGREVALKALGEDAGDGSTSQTAGRFFREACLQGRLEHPAVVPVHECGVRPDGQGYFTMKRVRGQTLADILEQRRSGESVPGTHGTRRLLEAFLRICLAVDFAHRHGVVHRDLKPSNVMLGDFGEVYLLDWGVSKLVGGDDPVIAPAPLRALPPVDATEQGCWMGTPGYMAPEQIEGESALEPADIYSLGAMLFELLTGDPLHARRRADALRSTLDGVEARPSVRHPELAIAPEFDLILQRATARHPADRYPSARALANDVERFLDGERDLSLRRQMAEQHLLDAREAIEHMAQPGADDQALQSAALRNLGHALALHPDDPAAMEMLAELMVREPHEAPSEVIRNTNLTAAAMRRGAARILLRRSLIWLVCAPLTLLLGYTNPTVAAAVFGGLVVGVGLIALIGRRATVGNGTGLLLLVLTSSLILALGAMFGPFVVVPSLVVTNIIFFILYSDRPHRKHILLAGVLTLVLPFLAELVGWVPRSTVFADGRIVILPRCLAFPEIPVQIVLVILHAVIGVAPAFVATRVRDQLLEAERKLSLAAWRMSQMVAGYATGGRISAA